MEHRPFTRSVLRCGLVAPLVSLTLLGCGDAGSDAPATDPPDADSPSGGETSVIAQAVGGDLPLPAGLLVLEWSKNGGQAGDLVTLGATSEGSDGPHVRYPIDGTPPADAYLVPRVARSRASRSILGRRSEYRSPFCSWKVSANWV